MELLGIWKVAGIGKGGQDRTLRNILKLDCQHKTTKDLENEQLGREEETWETVLS